MNNNYDKFLSEYQEQLIKEINDNPEQYAYPVEEAEIVVVRMVAALARGSANVNSNAIKRTCKILGIKSTVNGIKEYLN